MNNKFLIFTITILLIFQSFLNPSIGIAFAEELIQPTESESNDTPSAPVTKSTESGQTTSPPEQNETSLSNEESNESNEVISEEPSKSEEVQESYQTIMEKANNETEQSTNNEPEIIERTEDMVVPENSPTEEDKSLLISENILTDVTLKDGDGNNIEDIRVEQDSKVRVEYKWEIPTGHNYKEGATFTFDLPNKFKTDRLLTGNLEGGVGVYEVTTTGTVTFTFNESINDGTGLTGDFFVERVFDMSQFSGSTKQEILIPIKDTSKSIIIHFKNNINGIEKRGTANKVINPSEIKWVVDFNLRENELKNTLFKDFLPEGLELDLNSVEVYELDVNLDGSLNQRSQTYEFQATKVEGGFEIPFKDITSAYRVTYTTKITKTTDQTFINKAVITSENTQFFEKWASVPVKYSQPLNKSSIGYNSSEQTITWAIQYNYNEVAIESTNAWIEDIYDVDHQELLEDSIVVYPVQMSEDGTATRQGVPLVKGINYTVVTSATGFKLQFNQDISAAYEIEYKTKAKNRVHEDNYSVENTVKMYDGTTKSTERKINQVIFRKNFKAIDYKNKTIEWNIRLNDDMKKMDSVIITDSFADQNLKLIVDSFEIQGLDSDKYTLEPISDYTKGFRITFKESITSNYLITYKTKFDSTLPVPSGGYKNTATLDWNEGAQPYSITKTATVPTDGYTNNNGNKTGIYNAKTKEITWTIDVNYNLHEVQDAIIRDFYTNGQTFVDGSLNVHHLQLNGGPNGVNVGEEKTDFDFKKAESNGKEGLEIRLGTIDSAYRITYKTSLKGLKVDSFYSNAASMLDDEGTEIFKQSAVVLPRHGNEYIQKTGLQGKAENSEFSYWSIHINRNQSFLEPGAKLTDTLSDNQILLKDSIKLYKTSVIENGTVTKDGLEDPSNYKLIVSGNKIELTFTQAIEESYVLEYQAYINADNGEEITNGVEFVGNSKGLIEKSDSEKVYVSFSDAGGGAFPTGKGSLKIVKLDASTKEPLKGAIFGLFDKSGTALLETTETDEKGEAVFHNYKYKNYKIKELSAPTGYVISEDYKTGKEITFKEDNQQHTVTNHKLIQAVELTKVDQSDRTKQLPGAEFELQKSSGDDFVKVSTHITDSNGQIILNGLPPGDYQFVETKAPEYYVINNEPLPFTIKDDQIEVVKLEKSNVRGKGSLKIQKVDTWDGNILLQGAEFELYDNQGKLIDKRITDSKGQIVFEDLLFDSYVLKETKAPIGYTVDSISLNLPVNMNETNKVITVKNNRIIYGGGIPVDNPDNTPDPENPKDPEKPMDPDKPGVGNPLPDGETPDTTPAPTKPTVPNGPSELPIKDNPDDSNKDSNTKPTGKFLDDNQKQSSGLPKTGEKAGGGFVIGILFLLLGILLLSRRRTSH